MVQGALSRAHLCDKQWRAKGESLIWPPTCFSRKTGQNSESKVLKAGCEGALRSQD